MPALSNRQEVRERLMQLFVSAMDRAIPADESVPLKGETFRDFEDQAEEVRKAILPAFVEARAALESQACVDDPGCCPFCGSDNVRLLPDKRKVELTSPHGPVVLELQTARCRPCGRTFSPSGTQLGLASRGGVDPSGGRAGGPGIGHPGV